MSLRRALLLAFLACAIAPLGRAGAQTDGAPAPPESGGHGWITSTLFGGDDATLFHLPPRAGGGAASQSGVALPARVLEEMPSRLAWWGRRVYLLYEEAGRRVDVFSIRVEPTAAAAFWLTDPLQGATSELSLTLGEAGLIDAVGGPQGPFVLAKDDLWQLWSLDDRGWRSLDMPPGLSGARDGWVRLVGGNGSPMLLARYEGRSVLWELDAAGEWLATPLQVGESWPEQDVLKAFLSAGDVCVAVRVDPLRVEAWSLGPRVAGLLAAVEFRGRAVGAAALQNGERLAVLSVLRNDVASGRGEPVERWELVEVSLATGRELYRGPPRAAAPISGSDVRWLSLGMGALVIAVLFYLLRPAPSADAVAIPEGYALAEPGRRLGAGLLDAVLIGAIVALVFGVPFRDVLLILPLLESPLGILALGGFIAGGAAYGTLCEWLSGRTVGKVLAGCEVVSASTERRRPGLTRCAARNVFKWALAPWALLGLSSAGGRHRGDAAARAVVVVRIEGAAPPDSGDAPGA